MNAFRLLCFTLPVVALLGGCRCSKETLTLKREALPKNAPSSAPPPSASAAEVAPALQPIAKPSGKLGATFVLTDPPQQHIGNQLVPLDYVAHRVRGANLITQGGAIYKLEGESLVEQAAGGGLGTHPLPYSSVGEIPPMWMFVSELAGSWPSELWASVSGVWLSDGARIHSSFEDLYHGSADEFVRVSGGASHNSRTLAAWSGGRVIGLEPDGFRILTGPKTLLPKRAIGTGTDCPVRVDIESIAALPSGELYGLGRGGCDGNRYLVERWTDDSAESKAIEPLPESFGSPIAAVHDLSLATERAWLLPASPRVVFALRSTRTTGHAQARLARFDGSSWQTLPLPADRPIDKADAAPDGSLWLVMAGQPYVFDATRGFREVVLPPAPALPAELDAGAPKPRIELNSVVGLDAERAYFGAMIYFGEPSEGYAYGNYEAGAVLSTFPAALRVVPLKPEPDRAERDAGIDAPSEAGGQTSEPVPFSASCTTPFVILFSLGSTAPPDFDYPATRDALLGANPRPSATFVEFSYRGKRTLGAKAPNADQAKALVNLITDRVKGSKPTLVCFAPSSVIRTVNFPL